jgi:hypothetical protein
VCKFICSDTSRLTNSVDGIPRATIKIVESLQRERSFLDCFGPNALLELLAQEFELIGLQTGDGCWRG